MSDFTWVPSYDAELVDEHRVKEARFGDGYVQTSADGINPVKEVWNLPFEGISLTVGEAIRAFLRTKTGQSFTWTNPNGVEKSYRLRGDVRQRRHGPVSVTMNITLEEWMGP